MEYAPTHFTQSAGLICYYDTRTHYYLRATYAEDRGCVLGVVLTDDGAYRELADSIVAVGDWPQIHLEARIAAAELQFAASPDGRTWHEIGPLLDFSKLSDDYGSALHFTGACIGLCAQDLGGTGTFVDFADFKLCPTDHSAV